MKFSFILLAHNEKHYLVECVESVLAAIHNSQSLKAYDLNLIIVVDKGDSETDNLADLIIRDSHFSIFPGAIKLPTNYGDPGLARNAGVALANSLGSDLCMLLDSDDLLSTFFFTKFTPVDELLNGSLILHPEILVPFGAKNIVWFQPSWDEFQALDRSILFHNAYDLNLIASPRLLMRFPFVESRQRYGFGYEDWHFMRRTIMNSIRHDIIPGAIKYARVKKMSRNLLDRTEMCIMAPDRYLASMPQRHSV